MAKSRNNPVDAPTESEEQQSLFRWAAFNARECAELALMFHIPNGGFRTAAEAGRFKAEGVKPGVPDIFLPAARGTRHGLFIELKRQKGGKIRENQMQWRIELEKQGYKSVVAFGWQEAAKIITDYLTEGASNGKTWGF